LSNNNSKSIIAIGAHPDDIEIGCGGTIKKFSDYGYDIIFLIATLGEKCDLKTRNSSMIKKKRRKESIESANIFGVIKVYYLDMLDTNIEHNGITVNAIEKYIKKFKPEYVFTHTIEDKHQDHKNLAFSTISACRRSKTNILHYESPSTAQSFLPTVFSDISDTLDYKIKAVKFFASQHDKYYVDPEAIKGLAVYRGYISGSKYAEAFEVSKFYIMGI
jgi:LmbE family N-acetylglucosaminyl deacetylase